MSARGVATMASVAFEDELTMDNMIVEAGGDEAEEIEVETVVETMVLEAGEADSDAVDEGIFEFELCGETSTGCGIEFSGCHFPGMSSLFVTKVDTTKYRTNKDAKGTLVLVGDEVVGVGGEALYPGTDSHILHKNIKRSYAARTRLNVLRPLKLSLRRRSASGATSEPLYDTSFMHYLCKAFPQKSASDGSTGLKGPGCSYAYGLDKRLVYRAKNHISAMHYHMADDDEALTQKVNWFKAPSEDGAKRFSRGFIDESKKLAFGTKLHRLKLQRDFLTEKLRLQDEKHRVQDELQKLGEMPLHGPDCDQEKEDCYGRLKEVESQLLQLLKAREIQLHVQNDFDNNAEFNKFKKQENMLRRHLEKQAQRQGAKFIAKHKTLKKEVDTLERQQNFTSESVRKMKVSLYRKEMELDGAIRMNPALLSKKAPALGNKGRDLFPAFANFWEPFPSPAPPGEADQPTDRPNDLSPLASAYTPKLTTKELWNNNVPGKKI